MSKPAVTLVTSRAQSADELTDADYRDIYDELRVKCSLDRFIVAIGSAVSKAWWSKYERNEATLTRPRRSELRAAVGLPPLPPAVTDALNVDPDATIWQIGAAAADRVVMLSPGEAVTLRLNGALQILDEDPAENQHVTAVTPSRDRSNYAGLTVRRETKNRLDAARRRSGKTWDEFLSQLLA
jgi:hypothetical protein